MKLFQTAATRLYEAPSLLLLLTTLFWGGNTIAGQLAVGEMPPMLLVLARWIAVSAALGLLYRREIAEHWPVIRAKLPLVVIMATLGFTGFNALFYVASHRTTAVNIGIIQGAMPAMVLIGALLVHRTKVGFTQILGVILTISGVVLVAARGDLTSILHQAVNSGDAIMLTACVLYAGYAVMLKDRPAVPGAVLFAVFAMISAFTALPLAIAEATTAEWQTPTLKGWLVTLYVAIFPSCLSQLFFLRAVDLIGPGRAGVYINLVPIFAAILAVLLLGELFAWHHAIALALVICGIWMAQQQRQ